MHQPHPLFRHSFTPANIFQQYVVGGDRLKQWSVITLKEDRNMLPDPSHKHSTLYQLLKPSVIKDTYIKIWNVICFHMRTNTSLSDFKQSQRLLLRKGQKCNHWVLLSDSFDSNMPYLSSLVFVVCLNLDAALSVDILMSWNPDLTLNSPVER